MKYSLWFDTMNLGWSIVLSIEECQSLISNKIVFFSLKIVFVSANSADPDEMLHYAAFHLGFTVCTSFGVSSIQSVN